MNALVPRPSSVVPRGGAFAVRTTTRVVAPRELAPVGRYLAGILRGATGLPVPVTTGAARAGDVVLEAGGSGEAYRLVVEPGRITVAGSPAGVFYGVQTLRQLVSVRAPWLIPAGTISDTPRFAWRGTMLDVARHFFGVADVKRYIDLIAAYKLNRLHLHLSDDQGWRIAINSWPALARHGGSTGVGGGPGGYYTQRQYRELVAYAASRFVTIVPEIDMPGHVGAALSSYPQLACDRKPRPIFTGFAGSSSSLCTSREATYGFVDQVVGELAALTPGAWFHVGGDEAAATRPADYRRFVERVQRIVRAHGKQMIGWEEIGLAKLAPGTIVQHWNIDRARSALSARAAARGAKVIMSPAGKAYLDMKYDASTRLGLHWAGYTSVRDSYEWDPAAVVAGVGERDLLGVEAPLWSETTSTMTEVEYLAFPRLVGLAEISWSPRAGRTWSEYRLRLAAQGPRLEALGVRFYRSPEVPWVT